MSRVRPLTRNSWPLPSNSPLASGKRIGQPGFALRQRRLGFFALRHIDVGTDDALRDAVAVVGDRAARLDPADPATLTQDAVFARVSAAPRGDGRLEVTVESRQILRMHAAAPVAAARLHASLGQVVDCRIALRDLHGAAGNVEGEAANQRHPASERQLRVALGQGLLGPLAMADVAGDTEPA